MTAPTPITPFLPANPMGSQPATIANLTASLRADYSALQNDLEQAQNMAAEFQRQLAGKSNEVAHFKALLEKTQEDLLRMEGHITELRQERHRLANEVMISMDLKETVELLRTEGAQLQREALLLRTALTTSTAAFEEQIKLQQMEIDRLRAASEGPKTAPSNGTNGNGNGTSGKPGTGSQSHISELSATLERLESMMKEHNERTAKRSKEASNPKDPSNTFIDISFDS